PRCYGPELCLAHRCPAQQNIILNIFRFCVSIRTLRERPAGRAENQNPEDRMGDKKNLVVVANDTSRRRMIVGATIAFGSVAISSLSAWASDEEGVSHTAESIHQEPAFRANRKRVYEALTETKQFAKVTQLSAAMQSGMSLGNKPTEISQQA